MSRLLERAGIQQDRLGPLLSRTAPADNPARLGTPATALTGPEGATTHHEDNPGADDAPDPSFDQA